MLKNVLIVVDDIEKSIEFYRDLFGLQVILQNEGNVILSEGLVLQDTGLWGKTLDEISTPFNNRMELYFEEFYIGSGGFVGRMGSGRMDKRFMCCISGINMSGASSTATHSWPWSAQCRPLKTAPWTWRQ